MTDGAAASKATIYLFGTTPLFRDHNLDAVIGAIEADECFVPMTWGLEEKSASPYSRAEVLARVNGHGGRPLAQTTLYLRRRKAVAFEAALALGDRPKILFDFDPKISTSEYSRIFELADRLVSVFRPDFGAAHVWLGLRPRSQLTAPFADDDEQDAELMFRAAAPVPVQYYRSGPSGLGMRTYLGPHFVAQLGAGLIESCPLHVERLDWGGYRVDLAPEPWRTDLAAALPAWRRGMAHLGRAQLFAQPRFNKGQVVGFEKTERMSVGGTYHAIP
jgi:hypothetical protein